MTPRSRTRIVIAARSRGGARRRGRTRGSRGIGGGARARAALPLLARRRGSARPADRPLQRRDPPFRRAARSGSTASRLTSGEAEAALAARTRASGALDACLLALGQAPQPRRLGGVGARRESLARLSPQVIAMWEPLARALGWPQTKIGWKDILALATSSRGWADYGHPEYGPFRLGHTNPGFSTSGLSAVASEYYAVTDKHSGLSLADVQPRGRPSRRPDDRALDRALRRDCGRQLIEQDGPLRQGAMPMRCTSRRRPAQAQRASGRRRRSWSRSSPPTAPSSPTIR